MRTKMLSAVALMAITTGCAGATPPDGAQNASAARSASAIPEWKLGKYSTGDGMLQMVLDRTGEPGKAKLKIAGDKDIVELTAFEVRERGTLIGQVFKNPQGKRVLFVGTHGHLVYVRGDRDELPLRRDADAAPLGPATIAGSPPKQVREASASEKTAASLGAIAVTKRMPGMKKEDAGRLDKIAEAISLADKGMFVSFKAGTSPSATWAPVPGRTMYKGTVADPKQRLAKYKAEIFNFLDFRGDELKGWGMQVAVSDGTPADGTPGIVWDAGSSSAMFVTLDGGVYEVRYGGSELVPTVASSIASWPAPLQHVAVGPGEISSYAELGILANSAAAPVAATQDAWRECVKSSYENGLKKQLAELDKENLHWGARKARKKDAKAKWQTAGPKQCAAHRGKMEAQLAQFIESRSTERTALYAKSKARAAAIGLAK